MRFKFALILLFAAFSVQAKGVYQHPDAFLQETFKQKIPQAKFVWLTGETGKTVTNILQHKPTALRTRYWLKDQRSAWILEEIGKEKPITVGIVIAQNKIERVKVLIFRESRGWEIKRNSFTKQFTNSQLDKDRQLSSQIDGISGATLSVNAVTKLTKIALYLHAQVIEANNKK